MFHQSYPSAFPSYRTPVSQINPREKYLAALAEAKAAEAEYLAAEQLQQEENQLRQRLEQIQSLKHQPSAYYTHTPTPQYSQTAPFDLDAFRRRVAAEERARIVREQELEALRVQEAQRKARELEALRIQEAQRKARELEALRIHEARKAQQAARDIERSRALAAQRAKLEALTQRAVAPSVRFVVSEDADSSRTRHRRSHLAAYPEFRNSIEVPSLAAAQRPHHTHDCGCERKAHKETKRDAEAPRTVSFEQLLQHALGGNVAPQHQTPTKPAKEAAPQRPAEVPITLDQRLSHFLGAAGIDVNQSPAATSSAPASASASAKKEATPAPAPAPSQVAPAPEPATKPAATPAAAQAPRPVGLEHLLNTILGGASHQSNQPSGAVEVDLQQLLNTFFGGAAHPSAPAQPQAGPSKSATPSTTADSKPAVKKTEREEREERELAEAIRLSLADSQSESKGKAPAPAPVKDVASSTAEVHAIDASFTALANEFVFPLSLDFSTSRTASPTRNATAEESILAKLSYSTQNQPVRFYHQALSGLLARLDAVESFGDEALRHERKSVVERVEGAMDEVERVVEGKWRKWAGKERAPEVAPAAEAEAAADTQSEEKDAPAAPADSEPEHIAVPEPSPAVEEPALAPESISEHDTVPEPSRGVEETRPDSSSYPPSSEPASADESVATIRPPSPAPSSPVPSETAVSPVPSSIDTFLLPALSTETAIQKKPRASDSDADVDVGSDWSEVDA
ncbi:hypothetical protein C8R45DRAFT_19081 [Mycena sanguinolenta]|nr:hypothetical protein C8R45DRAFT_19081 [Mycena sanguinolenta]